MMYRESRIRLPVLFSIFTVILLGLGPSSGSLQAENPDNPAIDMNMKRIILDFSSEGMLEEELRIMLGTGNIILDLARTGLCVDEVNLEILSVPVLSNLVEDDVRVLSDHELSVPVDSAGKYHFRFVPGNEIEVTVYKRKSLAVALDGVRADTLVNIESGIFRDLVQGPWHEIYHTAYSLKTFPDPFSNPNSGPNHASIMTGVSSRKHGVYTNQQYKAGIADIHTYPHYLDLLEMEDNSVKTAFLVEWDSSNTMVQDPDYRHPGFWEYRDDPPENGEVPMEHSDLIASEIVAILSGDEVGNPGRDRTSWTGGDIDALFAFLDIPDKAGHGLTSPFGIFGSRGFYPYSGEYIKTVDICAKYIRSFLDAIANRPDFAYEEWQFVFTTDHGGFLTSHGYSNASCTSIWFLHTASYIEGGEIIGLSNNQNLAPTVLEHFGYDTGELRDTGRLDGHALPGKEGTVDEYQLPASRDITGGIVSFPDFDDDGFTITMQYTHPFFDQFRNRHLIIGTPLEQLEAGPGFGIYTDFEFWTGIGGRWGNSDGTITPDVRETATNRSLGVIATDGTGTGSGTGPGGTSAAASGRTEVYSLMPEAGRESMMAVSVDGSGTITLYCDRSDGYLYFVTGKLPGNFPGTDQPVPLVVGEFVENTRIWDRELTAWELKDLYDIGQLALPF